jgi:plastocyanin
MRDRLVIPILLPVLAVGAILLTIFSFGYVLLRVQEEGAQAWPVAIAVAAAILLIAGFLNAQRAVRGVPLYMLTALPAAVILSIGLFYLIRPAAETGAGEGAAGAAIPPPGPLVSVATDNRFSETEYTIVANQQYTLNFTNSGAALHNWHVQNVQNATGGDIKTNLIGGGQSESINFTIAQTGDYPFICDVHPVEMRGTLTVVAEGAATAAGGAGGAGAAGGGGQSGPGTIVSVATDNKFSSTQLAANANEQTSLTLRNEGSALHNLRVQNVKSTNGQDIITKLLPGGQSETIQFTIAQAGNYTFICDVHPVEMKGTLTVR